MILSDKSIEEAMKNEKICIFPLPSDDCFQPASIDIRLGAGFKDVDGKEMGRRKRFLVHPGSFVLACTLERVKLSNDIVAKIEGKSSIGRKGIFIHVTAGYVDPGWDGCLTLEIYNASNKPYLLKYGEKIAQIRFEAITTPVNRPYGHPTLGRHYQGSEGTVESAV